MLLPAPSLACRFWLLNISCRRTRLPLPRLPPPRSSPHPLVAALARRCSCPPSHALAVAPARRRTRSLSHPLAVAPTRHRTRPPSHPPLHLLAVAPVRRRTRSPPTCPPSLPLVAAPAREADVFCRKFLLPSYKICEKTKNKRERIWLAFILKGDSCVFGEKRRKEFYF